MNYIYDITLNFQKDYIDFYEWNQDDKLTFNNKIPIFKISNHDFKIIKNSSVQFDSYFINKLHTKQKNTFLLSNGKNTLGIKLNKDGKNIFKSSILLNDENKISNIIINLERTKINYKILKTTKEEIFLTRKEKTIKKEVIKKLNNLFKNHENEKIKYIFLECFNKKENNVIKAYNIIKKEINNNKIYKKIYDFLKTTEETKKG